MRPVALVASTLSVSAALGALLVAPPWVAAGMLLLGVVLWIGAGDA